MGAAQPKRAPRPLVARFRHLNVQKDPNHWRAVRRCRGGLGKRQRSLVRRVTLSRPVDLITASSGSLRGRSGILDAVPKLSPYGDSVGGPNAQSTRSYRSRRGFRTLVRSLRRSNGVWHASEFSSKFKLPASLEQEQREQGSRTPRGGVEASSSRDVSAGSFPTAVVATSQGLRVADAMDCAEKRGEEVATAA
jgi:hypothetical protein